MARGGGPPRNYRAGKEKRFTEEKMSDERSAWLKTFIGQFIIKIEEKSEDDPSEYGDNISIVMPTKRGVHFLTLTSLTGDELRLTRQFFNAAFDLAEDLCNERDKVAQDAWNNGDDSHIRIYRAVPELVVRERAVGAYGEVLRQRFANDAARLGTGFDPDRPLRDVREEVADEHPSGYESEDDLPEADQPEVVREVGGDGECSGGLLSTDSSQGDSSSST